MKKLVLTFLVLSFGLLAQAQLLPPQQMIFPTPHEIVWE
jgi:hypothetical protein